MLRLSISLIPDQECRIKNSGLKYRTFNTGFSDEKLEKSIALYERLVKLAREEEIDALHSTDEKT